MQRSAIGAPMVIDYLQRQNGNMQPGERLKPRIIFIGIMKGKRFTPAQIIKILKEHEAGTEVTEIIRKYGIARNTFYLWKSKYGGMENNQIQKLKDLELENSKLKKLLAERCLEIEALKDVLSKKW
jgi:putative transposase